MPVAMKTPVSRAGTPPRKPARTTIVKKPAVAARPGRRPAKGPFADKAYRELRARILDNSMPSGEQYTEEELAAMLQMSRTPTREAMLRLAGEGLVEVRPRHGMRIKPVSQVDMREIYEVLTALESTAAALAAARSDQGGSVAQLRGSIRDMEAALEGAIREASQGFAYRIPPLTIAEYDVDCAGVLDLRGEAVRRDAGIARRPG